MTASAALVVSGSAAANATLGPALGAWMLQRVHGPLSVHVSQAAGEGPALAREALERGVRRIVAVGGDGTVQEVASVVAGVEGASMGIVPMWTGNDFARQLGLVDLSFDDALAVALGDRVRRLDLPKLDDRLFVNLASLGPIARVAPSAPKALKAVIGAAAYVVSALEQLVDLKPFRVRLRGPEFELEGPLLALFVGNGGAAGGGRRIIPDTEMDDGLLDVLAVRYPEGPDIVGVIGKAILQQVHEDRHAWTVRTPWIELEVPEGEEPIPVSLDGEPVDITRGRFSCEPSTIDVAVPAEPADAPSPG